MEIRSTILIDDEKDALDALAWKLSRYCPNLMVIDTISDPFLALDVIVKQKPQCIFLDIQMPKLSGFDIIDAIDLSKTKVIITSAHDNYALRAIKADVLEYLLKPIDKDDLLTVYQKIGTIKKQDIPSATRVKFAVNGAIHFYNAEEIISLKAESNYTQIVLSKNRKLCISKTLKEVVSTLPSCTFLRIHNSYCVNVNHVMAYHKSQGGGITMSNGLHLGISRRYKESFLEKMMI